MPTRRSLLAIALVVSLAPMARAQEAIIHVDATRVLGPVSRYLTGACIEDVNHEIYGGIYSQMVFGESFQEPPAESPVRNFSVYDGDWRLKEGEILAPAGAGPKLVPARLGLLQQVWPNRPGRQAPPPRDARRR